MIYIFVATLIILLGLGVFAGADSFSLRLVPFGFLAASYYFLVTGQENLAENSAQLFFTTFIALMILLRSPRLFKWLGNFFEVG